MGVESSLPPGVAHLPGSEQQTDSGTRPTPQTSGPTPSPSGEVPPFLQGLVGAPTQYDPFSLSQQFADSPVITKDGKVYNINYGPNAGGTYQAPDETKKVSDLFNFYAQHPDELKAIQRRLHDAGLLDSYTPGIFDDATQKALASGISEAQGRQAAFTDYIDTRVQAEKERKAQEKTDYNKSLIIQSQEEVKRQMVAAYYSLWGTAPTERWLNDAIASGRNVFEIQYAEQQKPEYANSPVYQQQRNSLEKDASEALGGATFTGSPNSFSPGLVH